MFSSAFTCKGDSGSPLVRQSQGNNYHLAGILHGSSHDSCTQTNKKIPGLFANPYYQGNFDFIQKWMAVGELIPLWPNNDLLNYMKDMTSQSYQSLWNIYPLSNNVIFDSFVAGTYRFV